MEIKLIGIGHKARQGKDTLATYISESLENSTILHFADPLKEEVSKETSQPLIFRKFFNGRTFYYLRDHVNNYVSKSSEEMPFLHGVFEYRQINEYWYMGKKDPEILQIWGTDFRRTQNPNYWVNKLERSVLNMEFDTSMDIKYVIIPDLRFLNEYEFIKNNNGIYIDVIRTNQDGTRYLDFGRNVSHKSETELDSIQPDITVTAMSGDLSTLKDSVGHIISMIKKEDT